MQSLLLLHGAIGAAPQLSGLAEMLGSHYHTHTLSFTGHGGTPLPEEPFSIELFAQDVLLYLDEHQLQQVSIFGYSMGGYVALYLAKHRPDRVGRIITLATKFQWDEAIAAKEIQMLNPGKIEEKLPAFAGILAARHAPADWKDVLKMTAGMMVALGNDNPLKATDYSAIANPVLVMLGDRDKMVGLDETVSVYRALPNAQMCILPATMHPIEQVDAGMLEFMIRRFMEQ